MLRRILPIALLCGASALPAQSIFDIGVRTAPQFHSYSIDAPSNIKIREFSVPVFVLVPITRNFSFDVGTSYASSHVEQTAAGKSAVSDISGMTDTQIRANYVLGNDFVVLTAGVNLPTGQSTVATQQLLAANLIGSDFLAFPISNMGTGFGGTGGLAVAYPVGAWNIGGGVSVRRSTSYDPFEAGAGPALHYQPGNEYRARVGLDRGVGTGRFTLGFTYSKFGNDNFGGSVYNTGDRYITELAFDNTYGPGQLTVAGWDLYRTTGMLADNTTSPHDNIANGALAYGVPIGAAVFEPNVEGRVWTQGAGQSASLLSTFGLRVRFDLGGLAVLPSGGYSIGKVAAQDANALNTTADLTGWHAMMTIRLR